MIRQINFAINLSIESNRTLIIDTSYGAFSNDFNKYFEIPGIEYYTNYNILKSTKLFEKYEDYIISKVSYNKSVYYLKDKRISLTKEEILNSNEEILFFSMLGSTSWKPEFKIKLKNEVLDKILKLKSITGNYIGFHFRNTDRKNDLESLVEVLKFRSNEIKQVYLSTDDYNGYNNLKILLGDDWKILQYIKPNDYQGKNQHYSNPDKNMVIMEALTDMFFLYNSQVFIPSTNSSFSKQVIYFREKKLFFNIKIDDHIKKPLELSQNKIKNPKIKKINYNEVNTVSKNILIQKTDKPRDIKLNGKNIGVINKLINRRNKI